MNSSPGFGREELRCRYDVSAIREDEWHSYSDSRTRSILGKHLIAPRKYGRLLNAGAGVHQLRMDGWLKVDLDLFPQPIHSKNGAVCASVENLPFSSKSFAAVVCVGEVLAYCDPAKALAEFARVLQPAGVLVFDFGNSKSFKHLFRASFGRSASIIVDEYNGSPERTWVYDTSYIRSLVESLGFRIAACYGTHTWSTLARRFGVTPSKSLKYQQRLELLKIPSRWADLITLVVESGQADQ